MAAIYCEYCDKLVDDDSEEHFMQSGDCMIQFEEKLRDEGEMCSSCAGSGEGQYDPQKCMKCGGRGVIYYSEDEIEEIMERG